MLAFAQSQSGGSSGSAQEYGGPSIVSRDKSLIGERGGKLIDFRLYGSVTGVYDSGLSPVATDAGGNLVNPGGNYGVEAGFGVIGTKTWRRDSLAIEYHGTYRHYTSTSSFDGTDQFLNLRYGRALTKRITLDVKETAGTSSLGNGAFTYLPLTSNDLITVPANELFDNRTYFDQTRAGLIWQKSARLSFAFSGDGYVVRRRSKALAGLNGYTARADVTYRISKRQSVTAGYTYTAFDYQRLFGDANMHTATLGYNVGLGRVWEFSGSAGASYVNVRGLQTVQVDPAIVAIIGQATVVANFNRTLVVPAADIRLVRRFPRSTLQVIGSTGVSPGNGVYLTSRQNSAGAQYSFSGLRKWTMGTSATYSELSTLGQSLGKYQGYQAGVGATYKLANAVHAEFRYDYRHYTTQNDVFKKNSNRVSIGLAFSPGEKPLPIW